MSNTTNSSEPKRLDRLSRTTTLNGQDYMVRAHADPFAPSERRIFTAWVRSSITGNHQTITFEDGWGCVGQVGTERDSERYDHLAGGSPERIAALEQARGERAHEAHNAIRAAFPEFEFEPRLPFLRHELKSTTEVPA